jgi:hypothetical protein
MRNDVQRNNVGIAGGHRHKAETVIEIADGVWIRKNLVFSSIGGRAAACQNEKGCGLKYFLHGCSRTAPFFALSKL